MQDTIDITASGDGFDGSVGLAGAGNQLDVSDGVLSAPKRPDWLGPFDAGHRPEIGEKWLRQCDGPPQRNASSGLPHLSERLLNGRFARLVQDFPDAILFDSSDQIR